MKEHMLSGGFIESRRGDIAYYSEIDDKFLLRYKIGFSTYDELPVLFDFQYLSTFSKKLPLRNTPEDSSFKVPYGSNENTNNIFILNTGGTFNKVYDKITGELIVPKNNKAIKKILSSFSEKIDFTGIIFKDSLEMNQYDRDKVMDKFLKTPSKNFVIVHGTDTMHITAANLNKINSNRVIVLTGSMVPFSLDKVEASLNLGMAINFARTCEKHGVYICMNGLVLHFKDIKKKKGFFFRK